MAPSGGAEPGLPSKPSRVQPAFRRRSSTAAKGLRRRRPRRPMPRPSPRRSASGDAARRPAYATDFGMTSVLFASPDRHGAEREGEPGLPPGRLRERHPRHARELARRCRPGRRRLADRRKERFRHASPPSIRSASRPAGPCRPGGSRSATQDIELTFTRRLGLLRQPARPRDGTDRHRRGPAALHALQRDRAPPARAPLQGPPARGPCRIRLISASRPASSGRTSGSRTSALRPAVRGGPGQGQPGLFPVQRRLRRLLHRRELPDRRADVLPAAGRPGRLRLEGPQGRRADLHLLAVLGRRDPLGRPQPRPDHQPLLPGRGGRTSSSGCSSPSARRSTF